MWWDDATFKQMKLDEVSMGKLRAIDDRYRADYDRLGSTPWTDPGYQTLSDRRNTDVKGVLTPEQYKQWSSRSSGMTNSSGGTIPTPAPTK